MGWMARGRVMPIMSDVTQLLAASQILQAVAHGLVKPKGHKFQVTAKGGDRSKRFVQWPLLKLFLVYLGADGRRRDLGLPVRGRQQAARLERAVPVLELVQYRRSHHCLHGLRRAAALCALPSG